MTTPSRRAALPTLAWLALAPLWSAAALAQGAYPSQTIKFIITHPAGGLPDTVARIVGNRLQERTGQSVVIENRAGANGANAVSGMLAAPADGYSLVVTDGAILSINPQLYGKLSYDPKDVAPIAHLARAPLFLAIHPKVTATSLREFVDYVKARPGQLNYGSSGVGSVHHMSAEALKSGLGLQVTHVPFKGTGESVPALLGGHIDMLFSAYPSLSGAADGKQVRLLAANSAQRSALAPNLPTLAELIPGFDFAPNVGIYGRNDLPAAVVQRIVAEASAIVKEPGVVKQLAVVGVDPVGAGQAEFRAALAAESERVAKVIKAANIVIK